MSELAFPANDLPEPQGAMAASAAPPAAITPAQAPSIVIVQGSHGPGFLVRAVWYVCVGWWLTGLALALGYIAGLTVIGLPVAFMIFNKSGTMLTLRPRSQTVRSNRS